MRGLRVRRPASGKTDAEGDTVMKGGEGRQRKKRKRKPRYPKGFDPENPGPPPDPERWLPKHERAAFKKRRKGKNQPLSKGAQAREAAHRACWDALVCAGGVCTSPAADFCAVMHPPICAVTAGRGQGGRRPGQLKREAGRERSEYVDREQADEPQCAEGLARQAQGPQMNFARLAGTCAAYGFTQSCASRVAIGGVELCGELVLVAAHDGRRRQEGAWRCASVRSSAACNIDGQALTMHSVGTGVHVSPPLGHSPAFRGLEPHAFSSPSFQTGRPPGPSPPRNR